MKLIFEEEKELPDLGALALKLKEKINQPAVVFLEGAVGSGKTTFLKAWDPDCSSPTYSLINIQKEFVHADFYRLDSADELEPLGLDHYWEQRELFFFEWGHQFYDELERLCPGDFCFYLFKLNLTENNKRQYQLYIL